MDTLVKIWPINIHAVYTWLLGGDLKDSQLKNGMNFFFTDKNKADDVFVKRLFFSKIVLNVYSIMVLIEFADISQSDCSNLVMWLVKDIILKNVNIVT